MNDQPFFIVDVSYSDSWIDWGILAENNVVGAIIKATQGVHHRDQRFVEHLMGADSNMLVVGAYHWCDPTCSDEAQAERCLDMIADQPIRFLAVKVGQYWQSWDEWRLWKEGKVEKLTQFVPSERISENGLQVARYLSSQAHIPVLVYTQATFIDQYAPQAASWLVDFNLWVADYPEVSTPFSASWPEFLDHHYAPQAAPHLPSSSQRWTMWQFTRGQFRLPGSGGAKINLNRFNGTQEQFFEFTKVDPLTRLPLIDFYA